MTAALYVLGAPGAGKSTLIHRMLRDVQRGPSEVLDPEVAPLLRGQRFTLNDGRRSGVVLGGDHRLFPGTDRLSMGVSPQAVAWTQRSDLPDVVIGEGARLGTAKFLPELHRRAARLTVVYLDIDPEVCAVRRATRSEDVQNPQWVAGAATRARNAAAACEAAGITVLRVPFDPDPAMLWTTVAA